MYRITLLSGLDEDMANTHRGRHANRHEPRQAGTRRLRPAFVLIWGDDQYENFKEDIVPAFSVLAYEDMTIKPWEQASESSGFNGNVSIST